MSDYSVGYLDGFAEALRLVQDLAIVGRKTARIATNIGFDHFRNELLGWQMAGGEGEPPVMAREGLRMVEPEVLEADGPREGGLLAAMALAGGSGPVAAVVVEDEDGEGA